MPTTGRCCARTAWGKMAPPPIKPKSARRLVCRERSIVRDDGGRFTTPPPSRLEARSLLGDKAANELGAPVFLPFPHGCQGPSPHQQGRDARAGRAGGINGQSHLATQKWP